MLFRLTDLKMSKSARNSIRLELTCGIVKGIKNTEQEALLSALS